MKVVSLNANGIRSAAQKGFFDWMYAIDADIVCIQETKAQKKVLTDPIFYPQDYHCDYVEAQKAGYSGVAIYSKLKPLNIVSEMGYPIADNEGRYLQFDYQNFSVISMYLPSGTSGEGRQAIKFDYLEALAEHLLALKEKGKSLILCGDYNIAHKAIDLKNWKTNQKTSGFLPEERAFMDRLFGPMGFVDAFRVKNQEENQYSWWSFRQRAFEKGVGWRIDYQVITPDLIDAIQDVSIYKETRFSDHAPVIIDYQGEQFV